MADLQSSRLSRPRWMETQTAIRMITASTSCHEITIMGAA